MGDVSRDVSGTYDVVIIGAGAVGSFAAHAFAGHGAKVALIESSPDAARRFAGEWIHPPGVDALDRLRAGRFEDRGARVGYGFAVFPDDGSEPIELPYPGGRVAVACEHHEIVAALRGRAIDHTTVTYLPGSRVVALTERGVVVERDGDRGAGRRELRAERIVGADGRSSLVARHLGAGDGELLSYVAAVDLRGVELPREGFGHVVLGGPGPALLYRIAGDRVRACLDVPRALGSAARTAQFLWDGFGPAMPAALRPALRAALEDGPVAWAAARARPRAHYPRGRVIVIGDAAGHGHPLTAVGLTQGFLDAEAAAHDHDPGVRGSHSYAAELLASALYLAFRRDDRCASALRAAVYDAWRTRPDLRARSMQLLMGDAVGAGVFGSTFGRIGATAMIREVRDALTSDGEALARAGAFRAWMPWLLASLVPDPIRARYRGRATVTAPLPVAARRHGAEVDDLSPVAPAAELDVALLQRVHAEATTVLSQLGPRADGDGDGDGHAGGAIAAAAALIEARLAAGAPPTDPVVRRTGRWLIGQQGPTGAWDEPRGPAASALATARALTALFAARAPWRGACERGAVALAELVSASLLERRGGVARLREPAAHAAILAAAARALAAALGADGERLVTAGRRHGPAATVSEDDRAFCRHALGEVSRTFARPIAMLPDELETAVTCGYLLCRVCDTIEDHPRLRLDQRERLFGDFLDTLAGADPRVLACGFAAIAGDDAELRLGRNCARLMRVFAALGRDQRAACQRWIGEMARGMNLYVHREPGRDGLVALTTLSDLERYCYFVAGTVGHLLTDLFAPALDAASEPVLRAHAERFGAGLQLVNILKDVTEDRARGWSFIPRSACAEVGLEVAELVEPGLRARAHAAVAPVFALARDFLDDALRYSLAVPAAHQGVRLFCLLPLWMAVRTLVCAHGNDAVFSPGAEVKISRDEVEAITVECTQLVADDDGLARRYRSLWDGYHDRSGPLVVLRSTRD